MQSQDAVYLRLEHAAIFFWPVVPWVMAAAAVVGFVFIYLEWRAHLQRRRQAHRPGRRRRMVWH